MTPVPAAAVTVPPQSDIVPGGAATVTGSGSVSVKSRPLAATVAKLLSMVKLRVVVAPMAIWSGEKDFWKPGAGSTARVSWAVPLEPEEEVSSPDVLSKKPVVLATTSACTEQLAPAATSPPV